MAETTERTYYAQIDVRVEIPTSVINDGQDDPIEEDLDVIRDTIRALMLAFEKKHDGVKIYIDD